VKECADRKRFYKIPKGSSNMNRKKRSFGSLLKMTECNTCNKISVNRSNGGKNDKSGMNLFQTTEENV
jgi:hypothetical protein